MNANLDRHFDAEVWEEYAMGMRSKQNCESLEEHLLVCPACQNLLSEADEYIRVMKAALAQSASENTDGKPATGDDSHKRVSKPLKASAAIASGLLLVWAL